MILLTCRKLSLFNDQSINFIPHVFWKYCEDMLSYFGYFGPACLRTPKMIVPTCRTLRYLSAGQKYNSSFTYFLRYYFFKNPAIRLGGSILAHNSRTRILPHKELAMKYQLQYYNYNIFRTLGPFWALFSRILAKMNFPGKKGSVSF